MLWNWLIHEKCVSLHRPNYVYSMNKSRNAYLDIVKGLAIMLVVYGHSIQYGNGVKYLDSAHYFDNWLYMILNSFHMPLFMLLSGYLFYFSINKYEIVTLMKNKCRGLLLPIFSFGIIAWFMPIIHWIAGNGTDGFLKNFFSFLFLNYHLWFLWSVLLNSVITMIVHKLNDSLILYIIIWFIMMLIPEAWLHGLYSWTYPFFIVGYLVNKHSLLKKIDMTKVHVLILFFLFASMMLLFNRDSYAHISGQYVIRENGLYYFYCNIYRFFIGFIGSGLFLCLMKWVYDYMCKDMKYEVLLSTIGQCSLGIYCFQERLFSLYKRYVISYVDDYSIISTLLTFLIVGGLSFLLTYLLRNYRLTNLLLFGGR